MAALFFRGEIIYTASTVKLNTLKLKNTVKLKDFRENYVFRVGTLKLKITLKLTNFWIKVYSRTFLTYIWAHFRNKGPL